MAALLRHGARRIGGSPLQRAQAAFTAPAVAEERRLLLVPRRMISTGERARPSPLEVQQKKDELYEALSKEENWRNRRLLQDLAVHVYPRPQTIQWRRLRASKWATNVVRAVGTVSFLLVVSIGWERLKNKVESLENKFQMDVEEARKTAEALTR